MSPSFYGAPSKPRDGACGTLRFAGVDMQIRYSVSMCVAISLVLHVPASAIGPTTIGFTQAELNQMMRLGANPAKLRALLTGFDKYVIQIARRDGVAERALRGSLTQKIIRAPAIDWNVQRLGAQAEESAKQIKTLSAENLSLRRELALLNEPKLVAPALLALAAVQRAIDEGRLDDASLALSRLQPLRFSEAAGASDLWATVVEMNAGVAALQGNYDLQKSIGDQAYEQETRSSRERLWKYKMIGANASYRKGKSTTDNLSLISAIQIYRDQALPLAPRAERPDDWAKTKVELGLALWELGTREAGPVNLEAASAALNEALEVRTESKSPKLWADTKIYQGNVFLDRARMVGIEGTLKGQDLQAILRETASQFTRLLTDSRAAFADALKVYKPNSDPYKNAIITNNIVRVLIELDSAQSLEEAKQAALGLVRSGVFPPGSYESASLQDSIGHLYLTLYRRQKDIHSFNESVRAYESAIKIATDLGLRSDSAKSEIGLVLVKIAGASLQGDASLLEGTEARLVGVRDYARNTDASLFNQANLMLQVTSVLRARLQASARQ